MRGKFLVITALVVSGTIATAFLVQSLSSSSAQTQARQLPQYTASGDLVLPKNFHEWVYVGSPLTPNALNNGKANFPEYHNVYIEPGSYEIFKKTNEFPEGTILFKELQLTLPAQFPDGSRTEPSGRGFFGGKFNGAMLRAGLVDEISHITVPIADGGMGISSMFDIPGDAPPKAAATLRLVSQKRLPGGAIWCRYKVVRRN